MKSISTSVIVVLIITLLVLISLIIYFYNIYSSYKESSEGISSSTNESMNEYLLKMECINRNIFYIQRKVEESVLSGYCSYNVEVSCRDIFMKDKEPYYNCTVTCIARTGANDYSSFICTVEYNCKSDKVTDIKCKTK